MNFLLKLFQKINFIISYIFANQINEKEIISKIASHENPLVFDIGSNLGEYSKFVSKTLKNNNLVVHSFEPIKELLNTQKIKYGILEKQNVAVSDFSGQVKFFERNVSSTSSIFENDYINQNNIKSEYSVQQIEISKYILNNNIFLIDIVKIDTEGNDLNILENICKILNEVDIKLFKIEILFQNNNNFSMENFATVMQVLRDKKFSFIGFANSKYKNNLMFHFDAYFVNNKYLNKIYE